MSTHTITHRAVESSISFSDIAEIVTSFASAATAIAAFGALALISTKTLESQWNESFRRLYDEFWRDEQIALARRMISYDHEYNKIKNALLDMAQSPAIIGDMTVTIRMHETDGWIPDFQNGSGQARTDFSHDEIDATEAIDQFCSKCLQMIFTSNIWIFRKKQNEFKALFFYFWIDAIEARVELKAYMSRFWPTLANEIIDQKQRIIKSKEQSWLTLVKRLPTRLLWPR